MTAPLRTLVVDDEKLARDRLTGFLATLAGVELVGEAADGIDAVTRITTCRPDLVFLDVQMPGMDGFDVLRALPSPRPHVVFATAYDDYAIRAFEVEAVDYLLKPFDRHRVAETVGRVQARAAHRSDPPGMARLLERLGSARPSCLRQIPAHAGKRILVLPVDDVLWFGVEYRLVYAHTAERPFMVNYTLRELEERLDPDQFFRAHKSSLVNLRQVKEIVPWFAGRYKLALRDPAASEVPLSRKQARLLRTRLPW
jgi:DNA-binding LytR/AlgR family response regulator